jgi:uncharacterized protein
MCSALSELKNKGITITKEEELAAKLAILLHDAGHGPYSHALEQELIKEVQHEQISLMIMQRMNEEFNGAFDMAITIFTNNYPKKFLHQLVSGQLDVDRMDYLNRDSFFTGVAEGVIGYDRIIKMLTVNKGELMVEEKAIYSIEKFLVSRRLMYWQVYLHKTVLSAELMLVMIIRRARELVNKGIAVKAATGDLDYFLQCNTAGSFDLSKFCRLDDYDVMATIKNWTSHPDKILSMICRGIVERKLFKVKLQADPFSKEIVADKLEETIKKTGLTAEDVRYFVLTGEASNTTYDPGDERINILFKDGSVRDISQVDNALIHHDLSMTVRKYYLCYLR